MFRVSACVLVGFLFVFSGGLAGQEKKQDPKKAEWMRKLVEYCVTKGQAISDSMGYIPLPENVAAKIKIASAQIQ